MVIEIGKFRVRREAVSVVWVQPHPDRCGENAKTVWDCAFQCSGCLPVYVPFDSEEDARAAANRLLPDRE